MKSLPCLVGSHQAVSQSMLPDGRWVDTRTAADEEIRSRRRARVVCRRCPKVLDDYPVEEAERDAVERLGRAQDLIQQAHDVEQQCWGFMDGPANPRAREVHDDGIRRQALNLRMEAVVLAVAALFDNDRLNGGA